MGLGLLSASSCMRRPLPRPRPSALSAAGEHKCERRPAGRSCSDELLPPAEDDRRLEYCGPSTQMGLAGGGGGVLARPTAACSRCGGTGESAAPAAAAAASAAASNAAWFAPLALRLSTPLLHPHPSPPSPYRCLKYCCRRGWVVMACEQASQMVPWQQGQRCLPFQVYKGGSISSATSPGLSPALPWACGLRGCAPSPSATAFRGSQQGTIAVSRGGRPCRPTPSALSGSHAPQPGAKPPARPNATPAPAGGQLLAMQRAAVGSAQQICSSLPPKLAPPPLRLPAPSRNGHPIASKPSQQDPPSRPHLHIQLVGLIVARGGAGQRARHARRALCRRQARGVQDDARDVVYDCLQGKAGV